MHLIEKKGERVDITHKFCAVCGFFVRVKDNEKHVCNINTRHCRYIMFILSEKDAIIFYCLFCGKINASCQHVLCEARFVPTSVSHMMQIERPYLCEDTNCSYHLNVKSCFCLRHPAIADAEITEYKFHKFRKSQPNCITCNVSKTEATRFCHRLFVKRNLLEYLELFPSSRDKSKSDPKKSPVRVIKKFCVNVSVCKY